MSKKIIMGKPALPASADAWVGSVEQQAVVAVEEPLKRLTIDMPKSLHARFKADCALKGESMVEVVLNFLKGRYPDT